MVVIPGARATMSDEVVAKRANVRVSRAQKASMAVFVVGSPGTYERMSLWLWVGGTVSLGDSILQFRPNRLNLAFEPGDAGPLSDAQPFTLEIPLAAVTGVRVTSGPFKRAYVDTIRGTLSIRCPGVQAFADTLRERMTARAGLAPRD
jgi:hypothetical protein